ncbi:MAG: hypothetical protein SVM80_13665 [Halobacteriota archaeon]|nr:hypothetical protein [Halobacteriota archaeon]
MVLELEKGIFEENKWKFYYSSVYELDANEVEKFDNQFPRKNKGYRASQEEFSIAVRAFLE